MKTVMLRFSSMEKLLAFVKLINLRNYKIDALRKELTAQVHDHQVDLALAFYEASIVRSKTA